MNQPFHPLNPPAERRATFYSVLAFAIASLISFAGCANNQAYIDETPDEYQATKYRIANHIDEADRGIEKVLAYYPQETLPL